ncbi:MAG: toll/interleukin-1 receptor domain-containing protein, partial [Anaerolineae bacterium]|nr:toll/interleukin-1 receptor domain-containing protein [Anaerolineae bacterium]
MRLFISYARVDRLYCQQIVDVLDVHDVWYDHRLHAGQKWWEEILRRLAWCDGFIYLLSRESVASEYCQKEFAIATQLGKSIFPVLIHQTAPIPEALRDIQYADLSSGLDAKTVKQLLSAIYIAERENGEPFKIPVQQIAAACPDDPPGDPALVIDEAATALDTGDFDKAVFLLKRAREIGYASRFINIEAVLQEAESALEHQTYLREAEREYRSIQALIKHQRTFKLGCEAFHSFRTHYPDFDPDDL